MGSKANATFHSFKVSGKWYATERGHLSTDTFHCFETNERRECILRANDNRYPGLSSKGQEFIFVVIPDDNIEFGYPLMLRPTP